MLQTYIPKGILSEYVHMLWYWEDYHPPHPKERILPAGMIEITINLSPEPFRIDKPQQGQQVIPYAVISGAQSRFFVIETARPMSILSVWFKAGGALPFLGVAGHELANLHLPLEALWGADAMCLYEQLHKAKSVQARFLCLEAALMQRLVKSVPRHPSVGLALQRFQRMPHPPTIRSVLADIALSAPRFIQVFREDVGMTPKQFCRVVRFQRAVRLIARGGTALDVALACGYYDQSHFINDFKAFAGIVPSVYAPQSQEHPTNLPIYES